MTQSYSPEQTRLLDKTPPHDNAAEVAMLGSMILDANMIGDVIEVCPSSEACYKQSHAAIFQAIIEIYDSHSALDMVMLNHYLSDRGTLDQVGGIDYLVYLCESVSSAVSASHYAKIVRDKWLARQVIEVAGKMLESAYQDQSKSVADLLDEVESQIFQIARHQVGSDREVKVGDYLQQHYEMLERQNGTGITGIKTGFYEIDDLTTGLQKSDLILIAGRPGMGKTALGLCMAHHISANENKPVGFFSMEMSRSQLGNRLLCMRSGVNSHKLRRNALDAHDFDAIALAVGELADAPIFIDDSPGMSIVTLRAKARRMASKHGLAAIFIDYLQLMTAPGNESRQNEVAAISRGMKAMAKELDIPVVCLSQLNRSGEQQADRRPRMSQLRDSGALEQDADVIALMYREDYYHLRDDEYTQTNIAEVMIEKQRQGPTGVVKLQWHGPTTQLHNLAAGEPLSY